jgi:lipopolysaccharide export system protein LptA
MNRALLMVLTLFLSIPAILLADNKPPASRSSEPIKIKSDHLVTDNDRKIATFTGNVAARQGDLTIYSDKMVISYSEQDSDVSSTEAFGNVKMIQGERRGQSDHAIYDAKRATITLDGNPKVFQNNDTVTGKIIIYYLDEDRSEVISGKGSRVEAVIHPKEKSSDGKPAKP